MKKILLIITVLFLIVVGVTAWLFSRRANPAPAPPTSSPAQQLFFQGLQPGKSNIQDVLTNLGEPVRRDQTPPASVLIYPSGVDGRPVRIEADADGLVVKIVEPLAPSARLADLTSSLGKPEAILYGDYYRLGFALQVYPSRGVALLANPETGEIKERWYFSPTTTGVFQATLAPAFQFEPIPEQE